MSYCQSCADKDTEIADLKSQIARARQEGIKDAMGIEGYWNDKRRNLGAAIAEKLKPYFTNDAGKAEDLGVEPATVQIIAQVIYLFLVELAALESVQPKEPKDS